MSLFTATSFGEFSRFDRARARSRVKNERRLCAEKGDERPGRYAIGGGPRAVRLSGIPVEKILLDLARPFGQSRAVGGVRKLSAVAE